MVRLRIILMAWLVMAGVAAQAEVLQGQVIIRDRMALPPGAVLEVTIEDISRPGAPAEVIGQTVQDITGQPPFAFAISYDPARLTDRGRYGLRATIRHQGRLILTSDRVTPVLQPGAPFRPEVVLRRVP